MNTKRLLKLSRFLRELPKNKFYFGSFVFDSKNECGTVCCAIGWLPKVDPKNWEWRGSFYELIPRTKGSSGLEDTFLLTAKYFDITHREAEGLFCPYYADTLPNSRNYPNVPKDLQALVLDLYASPKKVAEQIERFVKFKQLQMRRNKRITSGKI